ncbi:UDP-N-acetylmuramoyl-L-alanyl-D-glutamate--2,6-diaminopimelate ligase [candidate division WOR-3 bacterium]|nr:UDP-N-acetylmuramoyl-L-alanyl-D-glutamate--2,6-diaminopimelate ligase [candidate division WOR-3 bacterium]
MQLSELFDHIIDSPFTHDVDVTSLEFDSRRITPGALFFAIKGERFDGHLFVDDAITRGAAAVVVERPLHVDVPSVVVKDARAIMGRLAQRFYGSFDGLTTIGITGTNGKTTTAFLIHAILKAAGMKPGLLGTIWYIIGDIQTPAERTTPESLDVFKALAQAERKGAQAMVMEVSSHALSLHRVDDIVFDIAVFTNLSQDHLDFHGTIDAYKRAKLHLFDLLKEQGCALINQDDPVSKEIKRLSIPRIVTYGVTGSADCTAAIIKDTIDGLTLDIHWFDQRHRIVSPLLGTYNTYNLLAACATARVLGIDMAVIIRAVMGMTRIPGRMERVASNVFVDYAHTPDAIKNALIALRRYCAGRLFIVFGCGGDRDKSKRPLMGRIASDYADHAIVTSDNPRHEDPRRVIDDITKGIVNKNATVIVDRAEAIARACTMAREDDIILVAGKGHEAYQIIGDKRIAFDDAEVIRGCTGN